MARHIVGLFPDAPSAQRAAAELAAAGFEQSQIQVVSRDQPERDAGIPASASSEGGPARFGEWLRAELARLGIGHPQADRQPEHVRGGGVLVSVDAQGREDEARDLLRRAGASNKDEPAETARTTPGTWQLKPEVERRPATLLDDTVPDSEPADHDTPDDVVRLRSQEAAQEDEESPLVQPDVSARDRDILEHPDQLNLR